MKTFRFVLTLALAIFMSLPFLQAQEIAALENSYLPKATTAKTKSPEAKKPAFDLSLGQQTASFEHLDTYVAEHLTYPAAAQKYAVEGTVTLQVTVSPKGAITAAKVVEGLGHGCDEVALQLVQEMPDWTPAYNYGVPVKSKQLLQFEFSLR